MHLVTSQVMLLAMGQTAFFGPASESLDYFAGLGHKPDGLVNPADYLLEVRLSGLPITVHPHLVQSILEGDDEQPKFVWVG